MIDFPSLIAVLSNTYFDMAVTMNKIEQGLELYRSHVNSLESQSHLLTLAGIKMNENRFIFAGSLFRGSLFPE